MSLDVSVPASLPLVCGDADQLAQVLQNLLDNAVKYGRPRGTVRLMAGPVPGGGRWPARAGAFFAVSDDGHGHSARAPSPPDRAILSGG